MYTDKIKWIFFDVGCTLVDEIPAFLIRARKQLETKECIEKGYKFEDLFNATIEASRKYQNQYKSAMKNLGLEPIEYDPSYEILYPETILTLNELKKHYKLGIIANQVEGLKDRLEQKDLLRFFDVMISSFDVKLHKPDEQIFLLGLKEANATASESMYVGDRLDNDVFPSKKLGFKTVWIKAGFGKYQQAKNENYRPDFEIETLDELIPILYQMD